MFSMPFKISNECAFLSCRLSSWYRSLLFCFVFFSSSIPSFFCTSRHTLGSHCPSICSSYSLFASSFGHNVHHSHSIISTIFSSNRIHLFLIRFSILQLYLVTCLGIQVPCIGFGSLSRPCISLLLFVFVIWNWNQLNNNFVHLFRSCHSFRCLCRELWNTKIEQTILTRERFRIENVQRKKLDLEHSQPDKCDSDDDDDGQRRRNFFLFHNGKQMTPWFFTLKQTKRWIRTHRKTGHFWIWNDINSFHSTICASQMLT